MSEPLLELRGLTIGYGGRPAVEALDLELVEGELVALLGPSGCGKTTTMRAIAGLLRPSAGVIRLAGADLGGLPANRRDVGLVFQSYALFPHLSVFENVAFGLRMRRTPAALVRERVAEVLALVGLTGLEPRLPAALSGGQQQRVALARAIVVRPRLLLLDEPLSNLDARLRLEMRGELRRLQRELGITMLYVTHDQSEALALADRVVVMRAGRIEQVDTPEGVWERPRTAFVAGFMGFENGFLWEDGQLCGAEGRRLRYTLPAGTRAAWLGWRPASVRLGAGPYRARVRAAAYLGETVEYFLDCELGPLKAAAPAGLERYPQGAELRFDLPLERACLVPK